MNQAIKFLIFAFLLFHTISDTAIVTYHLYSKYQSLTTVSCSDGANGLMSWGYKDLSMMFPYVTAWQPSSWNSPQCGSCAKIMWNGRFTYVTVIDQCGVINSAYSHFDMSKQSFTGLFGQQGIAKGTMTANFSIVASKYCQGNKKGVMSGTPFPWQNPTPQPNQGQQNVRSQVSGSDVNPLWVKGSNANNENTNVEQQDYSNMNVQSDYSGQNSNEENVWVQNSQQQTTQYGGYSYDKQNSRNERGGY